MTAAVVREDLTHRDPRERISKSFVQQVQNCGQRAWYQIHDPRPWVAPEKVTFGSAVDAGVEVIVKALAGGDDPDVARAHLAAMLRVDGEQNRPDDAEVLVALERFADWSVVHEVYWPGTATQTHIRIELPGIGEVDAHPDLLLPQGFEDPRVGTIVDIKTAKAAKPANAAATSYTELGLYSLLVDASGAGARPMSVAYWTYVRSKKPWWQEVTAPVTDHLLSVARHRVAAVARGIEADALLNDGVAVPVNSVFLTPPRYGCGDCQWQPDCSWAEPIEEEVRDAAA